MRQVRACGPLKVAETLSRAKGQTLENYYSQRDEQIDTVFMPIDVLADLTAGSNNTALLEYMAHLAGKVLVDDPCGQGCAVEPKTMHIAKEMADCISSIMVKMEDHTIDETERPELAKEIRAIIGTIAVYVGIVLVHTGLGYTPYG